MPAVGNATAAVIYQATRGGICAGWVEVGGRVIAQAPVLRRWLAAPGDRAANLRRAGFVVVTVADRGAADTARDIAAPPVAAAVADGNTDEAS